MTDFPIRSGWRCEGCGDEFPAYQDGHSVPAHAPGCDGRCLSCPVERQCGPITYEEAVLKAWAWRCADTLPDSAQSRRDALADAETLRSNVECGFVVGGDLADMDIAAVRPWEISFCRWDRVRESASAAFRAVPELRGSEDDRG